MWFRFYGQLNDFLPFHRRARGFVHVLPGRSSVKDAIEAVGVPHPEVDLVLVNDTPVDFGHPVRDGDRVAVYPPFRSIDLGGVPRVGAPPPEPIRFVLDIHLGTLASHLRLAGFDATVLDDDREIAQAGASETRVVLTRDRDLLKRAAVRWGWWVRHVEPRAQFVEVADRFGLAARARPFTRCLRCNGLLEPVSREAVAARLPPRTRAEFSEFSLCAGCGRTYWRGSHYDRLSRVLHRALGVDR